MSTEYRQFHCFNVIGTSGSGKTTFSQQLAEILAILYVQMDVLFWGPNWYAPPGKGWDYSEWVQVLDYPARHKVAEGS